MNRDDIIRMARDCGWVIYEDMPYMDVQAIQDALIERLERFADLVSAAEREACAKACEARADEEVGMAYAGIALDCAAAIRARGNT